MKSTSLKSIVRIIISIGVAFLLSNERRIYISGWAMLQWLPIKFDYNDSILFDKIHEVDDSEQPTTLSIPTIDVQKHRDDLGTHLEEKYGKDWRRRPLLLKGIWTEEELRENSDGSSRMLSLENLLQLDLQIPYFKDARVKTITPDAHGKVGDILKNITMGKPHKIGSQLILEKYPEWIREVAPLDIANNLFGIFFSPDKIQGSGPWKLFPALTTVPVFIASPGEKNEVHTKEESSKSRPFTTLHCEPIGNIAVQLSGKKKWTLVQPEHSFQIKPIISPDGRAFFASLANEQDYTRVPIYDVITNAGDAIWVPTWTWHRVDYSIESEDLSIAASLFHFRFADFVRNNALFSVLMIPAMLKELIGVNTQ